MNTERGHAQPNPISSKRIVWTGCDLGLDFLTLLRHLALNGLRHGPDRIRPRFHHCEISLRSPPRGPAQGHRISGGQNAAIKEKQHPLRNVDQDSVFDPVWDDMAIVYPNNCAGLQTYLGVEAVDLCEH